MGKKEQMKAKAVGGNVSDAILSGKQVFGRTNIGAGRQKNQDAAAIHISKSSLILAVADGLGFYAHSEKAAHKAVTEIPLGLPYQKLHQELIAKLPYAERGEKGKDFGATTLILARIGGGKVALDNIGDSRAFQMREGKIIRQTRDQSAIELMQAQGLLEKDPTLLRRHPLRSVLLNALGSPEPTYRFFNEEGKITDLEAGVPLSEEWDLQSGDWIVLATDGFYNNLPEKELIELCEQTPWARLNEALHEAMQKIFRTGKNSAGEASSPDNYTYIVYRHP